jgi:hypothetical protein
MGTAVYGHMKRKALLQVYFSLILLTLSACASFFDVTVDNQIKVSKEKEALIFSWPHWNNSKINGLYVSALPGEDCKVFDADGKRIEVPSSGYRIWEILGDHTKVYPDKSYGFTGPVPYGTVPFDGRETVKAMPFSDCTIDIFAERWQGGTMTSGNVQYSRSRYTGKSEVIRAVITTAPKPTGWDAGMGKKAPAGNAWTVAFIMEKAEMGSGASRKLYAARIYVIDDPQKSTEAAIRAFANQQNNQQPKNGFQTREVRIWKGGDFEAAKSEINASYQLSDFMVHDVVKR